MNPWYKRDNEKKKIFDQFCQYEIYGCTVAVLSRRFFPETFLRENRKSGLSSPWSLRAWGSGACKRDSQRSQAQLSRASWPSWATVQHLLQPWNICSYHVIPQFTRRFNDWSQRLQGRWTALSSLLHTATIQNLLLCDNMLRCNSWFELLPRKSPITIIWGWIQSPTRHLQVSWMERYNTTALTTCFILTRFLILVDK